MRLSRYALPTTKQTPADAEVVSHRLMLRAGMIRKLGAGIYTWLPLGLRVLRKVEAIVREEMNRAGAQEILMPMVIPAELWQESGRLAKYGPELLRLKDRHQRDFVLGPTHEEVVTDLIRRDIRSYKQLPITLYQIQTKFRDEIRPRFGIMRGREFLMKDAYSFHLDAEDLEREYQNMRAAYTRIFSRIGVEFRVVKADSGAIGGDRSEEFHVLAGSGEDLLAVSDQSDYAANIEAAETTPVPAEPRSGAKRELVPTPGKVSCSEVAEFLQVPIRKVVKTIAVVAGDVFQLLVVRGDHEINEVKVRKLPGLEGYRLATDEEIAAHLGVRAGYLGPLPPPECSDWVDLTGRPLRITVDYAAHAVADFVCGANKNGYHLKNVNWDPDIRAVEGYFQVTDIRSVVDGDPSPDGRGRLKLVRGIEVGHIFQNGPLYTRALGVSVLDEQGRERTPTAGCYGIGVSRVVAAVIEQCHDEAGIVWPEAIAPFAVIVCPIGGDKSPAVLEAAETLYRELSAVGVEVLLDDRGLRPGPMFADADLIGIPHRVVIGERSLVTGQFEYKRRGAPAPEMICASAAAVRERLRA